MSLTVEWIVGVAGTVMITIIGFLGKTLFSQIVRKLEEIVSELKKLNTNSAVQDAQIKALQKDTEHMIERLDRHAEKIHDLELKTNK